MSKYISGEEIINKAKIKPIELFKFIVNKGLQPFDSFGEPIPPPDVRWCEQEIEKLQAPQLEEISSIELLDGDINRFNRTIDYYKTKQDSQPSDQARTERCRDFILEKNRERDEIISEASVLKNKLEIYLENLESYRNRNASKNLLSWENFELHALPPKMAGHNPDEVKERILEQISSQDTLYIRSEVEKIVSFEDEILGTAAEQPINEKEETQNEYVFHQEGNSWRIKMPGVNLGNLEGKGFKYMHYLVCHKGKDYHTSDLDISVEGVHPNSIIKRESSKNDLDFDKESQSGRRPNYKDINDPQAMSVYKEYWKKLQQNLAEAQRSNDPSFIKEATEKLEEFERVVSKDIKTAAKVRQFLDDSKRVRDKISSRIRRALKQIEKHDKGKSIYRHFHNALKPIHSYHISYTPDRDIDWTTK